MSRIVPAIALIAALFLGAYACTFFGEDPKWALELGAAAVVFGGGGAWLLWRAKPALRANASLVIASVSFGVWVIEVVLSAGAWSTERIVEPGFDPRTALEVVRDLRSEGRAAVPAMLGTHALAVHRGDDSLLPLGGISTATTVFCNESGRWVSYRSDRYGFNNPRELGDSAEVVVIGDSYAHGHCVEQGDDLAGRLRSRAISAVNLGAAGNGPLLELATLSEYGVSFSPKTVVWLYYENDPGDLASELRSPLLRRYLEGDYSQHLISRQTEIDEYWRNYLDARPDPEAAQRLDPKLVMKQIATLQSVRTRLGLRRVQQGNMAEPLERVLARAKVITERAGARLLVVYVPSWGRLHGERGGDVRAELFEIGKRIDVRVVDFTPAIERDPDPDHLFPRRRIGHFNRDGYALLAETILEDL